MAQYSSDFSQEFSFRTRAAALERFRRSDPSEPFDLLIIGGGITGAAVARDACTRGLKVALVERKDFAYGTSSRSSKLIHGGLRYLENMEFGLVFEALAERALLLKTVPHMVRPLPFYLPVYEGDAHGKSLLNLGLWLYDLLALFRTPGFHQSLSRARVLEAIPFLRKEGLQGGLRYFDASMWDDVLAVETARSAAAMGGAIATYTEAVSPIWEDDRVRGFVVRDLEASGGGASAGSGGADIRVRAHRVVVCAGPWTDEVGGKLSTQWRAWLNPSKGVHLIFDHKRIPVPGAMVMSHPEDGRISFVIPRPDYGAGVTIVGTTDGPTPQDPDGAVVERGDVEYLLRLLNRYYPDLALTASDILSAYVGVRPLMGATAPAAGSEGQSAENSDALQKVSREHHIGDGPGGTVVVAGGKYTTHRSMAQEIVDYTLRSWRKDLKAKRVAELPATVGRSRTKTAVNPKATAEAVALCRREAVVKKLEVPEELLSRYGAEAISVLEFSAPTSGGPADGSAVVGVGGGGVTGSAKDPEGFPLLAAQLRHGIKSEMVVHLEDFYLRRIPLYAARADHGLPWAEELARVWAEERGLPASAAATELARLRAEVAKRSEWVAGLK
jgi:glycerol-3-phosphate dehydrogenase